MADKKTEAIGMMETKRARELLVQIINGATKTDTSLSEVLRLCMQLGAILGNKPLSDWARKEASGYGRSDSDTVPDYRKFNSQVYGDFMGPFGSGIKNAHIPQLVIDDEHRDALFSAEIHDSVGEIERIIGRDSKSDVLKMPWSADAIAYYQRKEIYENMALASAWRVMSRNTLAGILEQVRTRTLDFALKIDGELAAIQDPSDKEAKLESGKITQIFNTTISGGNVAFSGTGDVSQTIGNVIEGDLASLKGALEGIGLKDDDITELEAVIKSEPLEKGKIGSKAAAWMGRIMTKSLKSGLQIARSAAGGLIAQALAKFYGID